MSKPIQVKADTFKTEVLNSPLPTLVDFYADWCGPCQALAPVVESIATEFESRLKVAKVNVDENEALSQQYGVQGVPTLILFHDGREIERIVGYLSKPQLVRQIQLHLTAVVA
jgi:thioredoxin 1